MPTLLPPLQAILDAELAAGNQVAQTARWPPSLELMVLLRYRFGQRYELPGVRYSVTNDPHYWYAEYIHHADGHQQLLGCGFEEPPDPR